MQPSRTGLRGANAMHWATSECQLQGHMGKTAGSLGLRVAERSKSVQPHGCLQNVIAAGLIMAV